MSLQNCLASAEQSKNTPVQTQSGEVCAEEVQPVADGDHNESSNPSFALSNEGEFVMILHDISQEAFFIYLCCRFMYLQYLLK